MDLKDPVTILFIGIEYTGLRAYHQSYLVLKYNEIAKFYLYYIKSSLNTNDEHHQVLWF